MHSLALIIIWCLDLLSPSVSDVKLDCKGVSEQALPFDAVAEFEVVDTNGGRGGDVKLFRSVTFCSQMAYKRFCTIVSERTGYIVIN